MQKELIKDRIVGVLRRNGTWLERRVGTERFARPYYAGKDEFYSGINALLLPAGSYVTKMQAGSWVIAGNAEITPNTKQYEVFYNNDGVLTPYTVYSLRELNCTKLVESEEVLVSDRDAAVNIMDSLNKYGDSTGLEVEYIDQLDVEWDNVAEILYVPSPGNLENPGDYFFLLLRGLFSVIEDRLSLTKKLASEGADRNSIRDMAREIFAAMTCRYYGLKDVNPSNLQEDYVQHWCTVVEDNSADVVITAVNVACECIAELTRDRVGECSAF